MIFKLKHLILLCLTAYITAAYADYDPMTLTSTTTNASSTHQQDLSGQTYTDEYLYNVGYKYKQIDIEEGYEAAQYYYHTKISGNLSYVELMIFCEGMGQYLDELEEHNRRMDRLGNVLGVLSIITISGFIIYLIYYIFRKTARNFWKIKFIKEFSIMKIIAFLFIICLAIVAIAAGWIISLILLGISLIVLFIAICYRATSSATFAIIGNGKLIDLTIKKFTPIVQKHSALIRDHMMKDDSMINQIETIVNIDNINKLNNLYLENDQMDSNIYSNLNNNKESFFSLIMPFYFHKNTNLSSDEIVEQFATAIIGLISYTLLFGVVCFKNNIKSSLLSLFSEDNNGQPIFDDDEFLELESLLRDFINTQMDSILEMLRLLLSNLLLNLDYLKYFNSALHSIEVYEKEKWTRDSYTLRLEELSESITSTYTAFIPLVAITIFRYYRNLSKTTIAQENKINIDASLGAVGLTYLENNQLYKQLISDLFTESLEAKLITQALK